MVRKYDSKLDVPLDELAEIEKGNGSGNTRVFVGNLPYSTSWQDLKDHMRKAGDVLFCEILQEPGTALGSKGCGLVEFATPAAAQRAISDLTGTVIQGRQIFVREDRENENSLHISSMGRRVFVGNLAYSVSWQDLKDHMRQCGEVLHCDIMREPNTAMGSKGCGIVEFASASSAKRAIQDMTDSILKGRPIFVREDREERGGSGRGERRDARFGRPERRERFGRARSRSYSGGRQRWQPVGGGRNRDGGGNRRVFVGNLAYSVTWQELKDHMRHAGDVLFCEILKEPGTTLGSKGCAIVEYRTAAEARRAIRSMTDTELRGRQMWVREDREEI
ncbi:unnamed protein product [Cladocopium goreaui]|uniref:RNA-binding protein n=1 Tax=Cladocopium goreaui TaxID=2562237 RepID=A0A9P1CR14_9DINO|nr:unnamed protein product [Cladocopium goreaui]